MQVYNIVPGIFWQLFGLIHGGGVAVGEDVPATHKELISGVTVIHRLIVIFVSQFVGVRYLTGL